MSNGQGLVIGINADHQLIKLYSYRYCNSARELCSCITPLDSITSSRYHWTTHLGRLLLLLIPIRVIITLKTTDNRKKKLRGGLGQSKGLGLEPPVYKLWYRDTTTRSKDVRGIELREKEREPTRGTKRVNEQVCVCVFEHRHENKSCSEHSNIHTIVVPSFCLTFRHFLAGNQLYEL